MDLTNNTMLNKRSQFKTIYCYYSIYVKFRKRQNCEDREPISGYQVLKVGEGLTGAAWPGFLGVMELYLDCDSFMPVYLSDS